MFTGIVKEVATVKRLGRTKSSLTVAVLAKTWRLAVGDSVSINGVCSTVVKNKPNLVFEYMPETLAKTSLSALSVGEKVNLEPSLKPQDFLSGHFVQGHVDTMAELKSIKTEGNSKVLTLVLADKNGMKYLVPKCSIAIEGISLTVVEVGSNWFNVKIIPHTWEKTNLFLKRVGDRLNIEFDILVKHLEKLIKSK